MNTGPGWCALLVLALVGCGGNSGSTSVSGTDAASLRNSPAGVSTLAFMDLELIRPDALSGASGLPAGVGPVVQSPAARPAGLAAHASLGSSPVTLGFTNVTGANGGVMSGTITLAWATVGATTTYTETFNDLTVTMTVQVNGQPATRTWVYAGTQVIAVTGTTAVFSIPPAGPDPGSITATLTDNTVAPPVVKTWKFGISSQAPLTMDWTIPAAVSLAGEFSFTLPGVDLITVDILPPLTWNTTTQPVCSYPLSGTLTLDLVNAAAGASSASVTFGPSCGHAAFDGASLTLGGN